MKATEFETHVKVEPETRKEYEALAQQYPALKGHPHVCVAKPYETPPVSFVPWTNYGEKQ